MPVLRMSSLTESGVIEVRYEVRDASITYVNTHRIRVTEVRNEVRDASIMYVNTHRIRGYRSQK